MHTHTHTHHTHECTHACTNTHTNAHTHAQIHTHTHTNTHTHTHECTHTCTNTHAQTRLSLGESIIDNTHLCSNQRSCLFHSNTILHKGIGEVYFIVQTFMLWYQYYGNRETNITQCSSKLCDCKSTRIITYSNISNIFLL